MSNYTPIRRPNFTTPEFRSGAAIDVHVKADIAALYDSLTVRHIAGALPADFIVDALIEKVTKVTRHLRVLENVTVRDSKAGQERRDWHYSTRVDPQVVDLLPADTFVQAYSVTSRRARITVLLKVNPADPQPTLDITVDGTNQQLGFDGDYATLYAARALDADLRKLTA